ncbi:Short-chain dehydrogenase/reductase SDR - like 1, partial [Theobroma cacao]
KNRFGKLDILVNNAGIGGTTVNYDALRASSISATEKDLTTVWSKVLSQTYEAGEECLKTNYYGAKRTAEAFVPLLQLSNSPRIVNVSSLLGKLMNIPSEQLKGVFRDVDTEEKLDELLSEFLKDFKEGSLESKGWPTCISAYTVSKVAMNAYTRILARRYPKFSINCVCPGFVKTDMSFNTGKLTVEEGAATPVKLALWPNGGPSGLFFMEAEALVPLLQLSDSPRIVNVSSLWGKLKNIPSEQLKGVFRDVDTEEKLDELLSEFLKDFKEGSLESKGWPTCISAYTVSKVAMNAYTRILARRYPKFSINCVCPGFVKTDMSFNTAGDQVWNEIITAQTYELAEECLKKNYYGIKRVVEALAPCLRLSDSASIVNVTSYLGVLQLLSNEWAKGVLSDVESLTEERVEEVLNEFQRGKDEIRWVANLYWTNSYTRVLAKKDPSFWVNCVAPGFAKTDITGGTGYLTAAEGAENVVRLALLPSAGSSGLFFNRQEVSDF